MKNHRLSAPSKRLTLNRRALLAGLGGSVMMQGFFGTKHAAAEGESNVDPDKAPLLVLCEFANGWDTLYCLDPRSHTLFGEPNGGIYTGFDMVTDAPTKAVIEETGGTGLYQPVGSNIAYGPTMKKLATEHFEDLSVVRGINMGTLTHEVGRRFFLTGKFPRGLAASGSSLETWWAASTGALEHFKIPNLVTGGAETYNEGLTPSASGLSVPSFAEMQQVLRPLNPTVALDGSVEAAAAKLYAEGGCFESQIDGRSAASNHVAAWQTAQILASGGLFTHFDFKPNPPVNSQLAELYATFGADPANPSAALTGKPAGQAALAAQALVNGISQVVLVRIASITDAHFDDDWPSNHPDRLRQGFDAVSNLISYLKNTLDVNGLPYWDRTTLMCFSEFARTPRINATGGRDHHLASACLVAGNGIKGNHVVGGTKDSNYDARPIDLATGAPADDMGHLVKPPDVHATILHAAGLSYEHISNQDPKLLSSLLK